jgi:hypothetical protein
MQSSKARMHATIRPGWPGVPQIVVAVCVAAIGMKVASTVFAQTTSLLSGGPPVQVVPYVPEPGVPQLTITPGNANPFAGADGSGGSGTVASVGTDGGTEDGNVGDSDALTTMLGTSWGGTAVSNATALGVNPSALAATCVLESGCSQPVAGSGAQGVFQMYPTAFQEGLNTALAANPALASQIVQGSAGMNDPTTEAIAASGYLMQANQILQSDGISNPTVMEARAYYQFGPTYGPQVAQASPDMIMASLLPASWLTNNGISSTETVSQWEASVQSKIGNAAGQSVRG